MAGIVCRPLTCVCRLGESKYGSNEQQFLPALPAAHPRALSSSPSMVGLSARWLALLRPPYSSLGLGLRRLLRPVLAKDSNSCGLPRMERDMVLLPSLVFSGFCIHVYVGGMGVVYREGVLCTEKIQGEGKVGRVSVSSVQVGERGWSRPVCGAK